MTLTTEPAAFVIAVRIALSNQRIGFVNNSGQVFVKEISPAPPNVPTTAWTNITQTKVSMLPAINKIAICGKRILAMHADGKVQGTSPDSLATWAGDWTGVLTDSASDIAITENRILVVKNNGELWVKEGDWGAGWNHITPTSGGAAESVTKIVAKGNRILVLTAAGRLFGTAPENFSSGTCTWTQITDARLTHIQEIALSQRCAAVITENNGTRKVYIQTGRLDQQVSSWSDAWSEITTRGTDTPVSPKKIAIQDCLQGGIMPGTQPSYSGPRPIALTADKCIIATLTGNVWYWAEMPADKIGNAIEVAAIDEEAYLAGTPPNTHSSTMNFIAVLKENGDVLFRNYAVLGSSYGQIYP